MAELEVTRLLQNPLGQIAPAGERGDLVRVSDGRATVYLDPRDFERANETQLRSMLSAVVVDPEPGTGADASDERPSGPAPGTEHLSAG